QAARAARVHADRDDHRDHRHVDRHHGTRRNRELCRATDGWRQRADDRRGAREQGGRFARLTPLLRARVGNANEAGREGHMDCHGQLANEVGDRAGPVHDEAWEHEDVQLYVGGPMSRLMHGSTRRRRRAGMTLIEIMISLILLAIVGGTTMRVIMRQQRFYQGVNQIMTQRGQLRQATAVLPIDLRSLSSIGDDIIAANDSSMEFMVNIGTGIVCEVVNGSQVALPITNLASGQTLTSWYGYGEPSAGATVYIYNDSSVVGNEEDRWQKFTLVDMHHDSGRCTASFHGVADLGKQRPILELSSTEPNDPVTGGPLSQYIN